MNLDLVQPSEIRVLVGGDLCNIEGQPSAERVKMKCAQSVVHCICMTNFVSLS